MISDFQATLFRLVRGWRGPEYTLRELAILHVVASETYSTVKDIAAHLELNRPCVTRSLDALERNGFVRRCENRDDRRSIRVRLTPKGKTFVSTLHDEGESIPKEKA